MISVEEAISLIEKNVAPLTSISQELEKSLGYVLAEDIKAPIDLPPFNQSAMDGYAIAHLKTTKTNRFKIIGEVQAGDTSTIELEEGEAVRIFTGAMIPKGVSAVVMQEMTEVEEAEVVIQQDIAMGSNIRLIGEQVSKNQLALAKGTVLNPAGIGYLSSLGIDKVRVFSKPKVGLIVTGNELVKAGNALKPGQIFESNSSMLVAAFRQFRVELLDVEYVEDDLNSTIECIKGLLNSVDVLVLSGGISVGDYDFIGQALGELGVEQIFYKVKQKPGKPLFFGKKENCRVFALPGNPSASLSCFYHYVLPYIQLKHGKSPHTLEKIELVLNNDYSKKGDHALFLKAMAVGEKVEVLEGQSSAMLHTFAVANALIYLPSHQNEVRKGEKVATYLLPRV